MKTEVILLGVCVLLCIGGLCAQESAESGEEGGNQRGARGGNQGGGGNLGGPGGITRQGGPDSFNPLGLGGRQLQIFNTRLGFVREELNTVALAVGRFLLLGKEQTSLLKDELQLALEIAIFGLPHPAPHQPGSANPSFPPGFRR